MERFQTPIKPADYGCLNHDYELIPLSGYVRRGSTVVHGRTAHRWLLCPVQAAFAAEFRPDTGRPNAPKPKRIARSLVLQLASDVVTKAITSDTAYTDGDVDRLIRIGLEGGKDIQYDEDTGTYHEVRQKTRNTAKQLDSVTKDLFAQCTIVTESNPSWVSQLTIPGGTPVREIEFRADTWLRGVRAADKTNIVAFYGHRFSLPHSEDARVAAWAGIVWEAYARERSLGQDLRLYSINPFRDRIEVHRVDLDVAIQYYWALMDSISEWYINTGGRMPSGPGHHCTACTVQPLCLYGGLHSATKDNPTCYWK